MTFIVGIRVILIKKTKHTHTQHSLTSVPRSRTQDDSTYPKFIIKILKVELINTNHFKYTSVSIYYTKFNLGHKEIVYRLVTIEVVLSNTVRCYKKY